jgi:arylformamidase
MKRTWIDVSVMLHTGMVNWPGDSPVSIVPFKEIARGGSSNVTRLSMGAHTGTHMDAPRRVIEIRDRESIEVEELRHHRIRRGERILFKTYGSAARWRRPDFDVSYVYITADAARFLAERGVRTVGVDYLSVGGYKKDGAETHRALLGAGIWIIEGLNLSGITPGRYDLVCLPLRILASDGAPARAALRKKR